MDRLDELSVLIAILDAGSLAAAGRRLRRSPPAVTRILTALEARVGMRLVERSTRHLSATEAGARLAEHARRLLADYEAAVREDADAPLHGRLRITAPRIFGRRHVTPVVTSYLDKYPAMRVELVLSDANLDLIEEGLDVAVRIGTLVDASLVARRVGEVRRVWVASPEYLARRGRPSAPGDLGAHDVVYTASRPVAPEWRFRHAGREQVVSLTPRLTVNAIDATLLAVKSHRGIGRVLSYQVVDDLAAGTLVRLLAEYEPPPLPVHLVMPSARHMAPKLRAFLDHAAEQLGRLDVISATALKLMA